MATSPTEIANLALAHLGVGEALANMETDQTDLARSVRRVYEVAVREVLRAFPWPFAMRRTRLALVEEAPNDEWGFSYRYPASSIRLIAIVQPGIRNPGRGQKVPYELEMDDAGGLILTDMPEAEMHYIDATVSTAHYPPDFVQALSYLLAHYLAPQLTKGDPHRLGDRAYQHYRQRLSEAAANAGNESEPDLEPESDFYRARL